MKKLIKLIILPFVPIAFIVMCAIFILAGLIGIIAGLVSWVIPERNIPHSFAE
jgi:hypothetical protein